MYQDMEQRHTEVRDAAHNLRTEHQARHKVNIPRTFVHERLAERPYAYTSNMQTGRKAFALMKKM